MTPLIPPKLATIQFWRVQVWTEFLHLACATPHIAHVGRHFGTQPLDPKYQGN